VIFVHWLAELLYATWTSTEMTETLDAWRDAAWDAELTGLIGFVSMTGS
jgi:predicted component of type VI protein secretion system